MQRITFQTFFELEPTLGAMTKFTVNAGGETVRMRCAPFFGAYKYYKLGPVTIKLTPAATLPVDPTRMTYTPTEGQMDPRDQTSPGLIRITNGENVSDPSELKPSGSDPDHAKEIKNNEYSYYSMMLDQRWGKFPLQKGCRRTGVPLYWSLGSPEQNAYPTAISNVPYLTGTQKSNVPIHIGTSTVTNQENDGGAVPTEFNWSPGASYSNGRAIFQMGGLKRMGWMPTDMIVQTAAEQYEVIPENMAYAPAPIPVTNIFTIILPPFRKTKYYFRCFVTETVYFKGLVVNNCFGASSGGGTGSDPYIIPQLDRHVYMNVAKPYATKSEPQPTNLGPRDTRVENLNDGSAGSWRQKPVDRK